MLWFSISSLALALGGASAALPTIPADGRGAAGTGFVRLTAAAYPGGGNGDVMRGGTEPAGVGGRTTTLGLPSARLVSETIAARPTVYDTARHSVLYTAFGILVTHDLTRTAPGTEKLQQSPCAESTCGGAGFSLPPGLPSFVAAPAGIPFTRSAPGGTGTDGARTLVNLQSHYLDLSSLYGPDETTMNKLRAGTGGRLAMDDLGEDGTFLRMSNDPALTTNARSIPGGTMASGDPRNVIHSGAAAVTVVFAREHNRVAGEIAAAHPELSEDAIFQAARIVTTARYRSCVTKEYLTVLTGARLPPYTGYSADVDPRIALEFSTAAFRFGHSSIPASFRRIAADGSDAVEGPLLLRDAYFDHRAAYPATAAESGPTSSTRLEDVLRGLAATPTASAHDARIVDDMRQHHAAIFDIAATNIMRGRDHGLPGYTAVRRAFNLSVPSNFADFERDLSAAGPGSGVGALLGSVYASIDDVDLWVGGLMERSSGVAEIGETFSAIILNQFARLRDGDPSWTPASGAEYVENRARQQGEKLYRGVDGRGDGDGDGGGGDDGGGDGDGNDSGANGDDKAEQRAVVEPLLNAQRQVPVPSAEDAAFSALFSGGSPTITRLLEHADAYGTLGFIIRDNTRVGDTYPVAAMSAQPCVFDASALAAGGSSPLEGGGALGSEFTVKLMEDLTLIWAVDPAADEIEITLIGPSSGYMAIGFGARTMVDLDIWMCTVEPGGAPNVMDKFSRSFDPTLDDPDNPAGDVVPGSVRFGREGLAAPPAGFHAITFRRKLSTGDTTTDRPISAGSVDISFSLGASMAQDYHGPRNRGAASIDFFKGQLTANPTASDGLYNIRVLHAIGMIAGWAIFLPAGVYIARFQKHRSHWLTMHRVIQSLGSASAVPLMIAAVTSVTSGHGASIHAILGLCFLALLLLQLVTGNSLALLLDKRAIAHAGKWVRPMHRIFGWMMLCVSPYQIYRGMIRLELAVVYRIIYLVWMSLVLVVYLVTEARQQMANLSEIRAETDAEQKRKDAREVREGETPLDKLRRAVEKARAATRVSSGVTSDNFAAVGIAAAAASSSKEGLQLITPAGLAGLVAQGKRTVIIDGFVIDVEGWVNFHPGGRFAILDRLGTDVSDVFRGHSESAHGKHRHSAGARSKMRKLRIARYLALDDDKSAERRLEAVGELHAFTWDQIQKETDSGALWIVIEGFILDVSSFFHAHPGGGRVLLSRIGTDATEAFRGRGGSGTHAHSDRAQEALRTLILGRVEDPDSDPADFGGGSGSPRGEPGSKAKALGSGGSMSNVNFELVVGRMNEMPSPRLPPARDSFGSGLIGIPDPLTGSLVPPGSGNRRSSVASIAIPIWVTCRIVAIAESKSTAGVFLLTLAPPNPLRGSDGGKDGDGDGEEGGDALRRSGPLLNDGGGRGAADPESEAETDAIMAILHLPACCNLRLRAEPRAGNVDDLESRPYTPYLGPRVLRRLTAAGQQSGAGVVLPMTPSGSDHNGAVDGDAQADVERVPLGAFSIAVRLVANGAVSPRLCSLSPGDIVQAQGPLGRSIIGEPNSLGSARHIAFLGAGTGVTPAIRMLEVLAGDGEDATQCAAGSAEGADSQRCVGWPLSLTLALQCTTELVEEPYVRRLVSLCSDSRANVCLTVLRSAPPAPAQRIRMDAGVVAEVLRKAAHGRSGGTLVIVCGPPKFEEQISRLVNQVRPNDEVFLLR